MVVQCHFGKINGFKIQFWKCWVFSTGQDSVIYVWLISSLIILGSFPLFS
ncbi:hypothetical protein RchiOBHm_Chr1g0379141 [Rosa chinensis]|uniref:Uncharacterized protein n=1 Tax=Rosa chinensis TaxID=74649 RepID=A0A2P6SNJ6_ROSCH|nr:hypothetical protein RchiOBHm_Chr1g0379141 [Rosa chinensis]